VANPPAAHPFEAARPTFDQNSSLDGSNNGISHLRASCRKKLQVEINIFKRHFALQCEIPLFEPSRLEF
jgi:hypothetical protein